MKKEILKNGWKMEEQDEMQAAAGCMTYAEYRSYKEAEKKEIEKCFKFFKVKFEKLDAMYTDAIIQAVGRRMYTLFIKYRKIEKCGVNLYAI